MKRNILQLGLIFMCFCQLKAQTSNVGIGTSTPDITAKLDITTANDVITKKKGLLIPRVALTSTKDRNTIYLPTTSLMVYNTSPANSGDSAVVAGYYYFNGTVWVRLITNAWLTDGNLGTIASTAGLGSPVNNNFIGTEDSVDFVMTTGNLERLRIKGRSAGVTRQGYIGIGTQNPTKRFQIVEGVTGTTTFPISLWSNCLTCGNQNTGTGIKLSNGSVSANEDLGSVELSAVRKQTGGSADFIVRTATGTPTMYEHLRIEGNTGYTSLYAATGSGTYTSGFRPSSALHILSTITNPPQITLGISANPAAADIELGSIAAKIDTAAANSDIAAIKFSSDAGWPAAFSNTDQPSRITFSTTPDGTGTLIERMRIINDGDVGINVTNPTHKLDIFSNVNSKNTINAVYAGRVAGTNWDNLNNFSAIHGEGTSRAFSAGVYGYKTPISVNSTAGVVGAIDAKTWGGLGYQDANGNKWATYDSGSAHISGFLQVGNTQVPGVSNDTIVIYNIDFNTNKYWNYSRELCTNATIPANTINITSTGTVVNGIVNNVISLYSPQIWVPATQSQVFVRMEHSGSADPFFGGGIALQVSLGNGEIVSPMTAPVSTWNTGGYNTGASISCASNFSSTWGTVPALSISNGINIYSNTWLQFRVVNQAGTYLLSSYTIKKFSLLSIGSLSFPANFADGSIYAEGNIFAQSTSQIGDVAEYFPVEGKSKPGMLISMSEKGSSLNRISNGKMDAYIFGVHSKSPSVLLNSPKQGIPVALAGRTDVKVVYENGGIKAGDYLTASSTPGYAMKATEPCYIIGRAMQNAKGDSVMAIIQPGWYNPTPYSEKMQSSSATYAKNLKSLKVFDNAVNKRSKVFVSFRGNPGSTSWVGETGDGYFTLLLANETTQDIPFDYLVNNPNSSLVSLDNAVAEKDKTGYISDETAFMYLNSDDSSKRVNVNFGTPPPPPDPSKFWTWDPIKGYEEFNPNAK